MHNMPEYLLPQYYQPKWVAFMAWSALVMWYTFHELETLISLKYSIFFFLIKQEAVKKIPFAFHLFRQSK